MKFKSIIESSLLISLLLFLTETYGFVDLFSSKDGAFLGVVVYVIILITLSQFQLRGNTQLSYFQRLWGTFRIGVFGILIFIILSWVFYGFYHIENQPFFYGATDRVPKLLGIAAVKFLETIIASLFSIRLRRE